MNPNNQWTAQNIKDRLDVVKQHFEKCYGLTCDNLPLMIKTTYGEVDGEWFIDDREVNSINNIEMMVKELNKSKDFLTETARNQPGFHADVTDIYIEINELFQQKIGMLIDDAVVLV